MYDCNRIDRVTINQFVHVKHAVKRKPVYKKKKKLHNTKQHIYHIHVGTKRFRFRIIRRIFALMSLRRKFHLRSRFRLSISSSIVYIRHYNARIRTGLIVQTRIKTTGFVSLKVRRKTKQCQPPLSELPIRESIHITVLRIVGTLERSIEIRNSNKINQKHGIAVLFKIILSRVPKYLQCSKK